MGNHKQYKVICDGMEIKPKDKRWTATSSHTAWILLACSLFIATFGVTGAVNSIIYAVLFTLGVCTVVGFHSVRVSRDMLSGCDVSIQSHGTTCIGLEKVLDSIKDSPSSFKFDKRLTGSSDIDEALQEVLENFFRDYISYWYTKVSEHEQFPYDLRQSLQSAIITLANRFKDVEWVPFFTTRLVDDFATHLKIFRVFRERLTRRYDDMGSSCKVYPDLAHEIDEEEVFFQVEREIEKGISREAICRDDEKEILYLQTVAETLLYLLLPPEDFRNITTKYFLREITACSVLLPTFNMICDPDYVNQTVSWLCTKEETYTIETFLTAIKITDDADDLEETIRKLDSEIAKLRALDSESALSTESENMMKKRLSSLLYVRKLCVAHCKRLKGGEIVDPMANPLEGGPEVELLNLLGQNAPKLPLKTILENNTALSYFIEFMAGHTAEHYVFFYLTVEGFRVTAEQQLSILAEQTLKAQDNGSPQPGEKDFEQLKQAAINIYEEYISPKASPRINLDDQVVRKIVRDIKSSEPSGSYFDTAQIQVLKVLESPKYYGAFLSSISYVKCLMDLDYLKEKSDDGTADDDVVSTTSFDTSNSKEYKSEPDLVETIWTLESDSRYSATIIKCGVCKEAGKAYGVYSIQVCRTTSEGSANWVVCRRYSDFHDLHVQLKEKFSSLSWLNLPGKKTFGTLDKNFIEKRKVALEEYLQTILSTTLMSENPGMFELVAGFLEMGEYYKGKGMLSRTVHDLVQPIKSSVSTVSHALRSKTEPVSKNYMEPADKSVKAKEVEQDLILSKLSENFDSDDDDNIPLRILLLLMDEIFDLKDRNQWLRRRIVVILRQFIKATFGDRINRKIVDSVEWATSAQQLTEYVRKFRDSFWPGGVLAEAAPVRPDDVRRRMRMVTRAKMIGSIPDELKRFLGREVTREGVTRLFDMLQHVNLNKRLLYVLVESFLETVFPGNRFRETFMKIHSKSKF